MFIFTLNFYYKIYVKFNTFILCLVFPTMFAFFWIGVWHGAGLNFILFGLLHGSYLVLFNVWIKIKYLLPHKIKIKNEITTNIISH